MYNFHFVRWCARWNWWFSIANCKITTLCRLKVGIYPLVMTIRLQTWSHLLIEIELSHETVVDLSGSLCQLLTEGSYSKTNHEASLAHLCALRKLHVDLLVSDCHVFCSPRPGWASPLIIDEWWGFKQYLVGGIATPLKNMSRLGWWYSQYMEK